MQTQANNTDTHTLFDQGDLFRGLGFRASGWVWSGSGGLVWLLS
jgi:hypothetical protein